MPAEIYHAPMPVEIIRALEPAVTSLPASAVMDAMQRLSYVSYSDPACLRFPMHEPPPPVSTSNVPTTSITTNTKTSRSIKSTRSSGRRTTKKPPGVPSFASWCYSAISHSSIGMLYLNEIYTWVHTNYTNFDPADIKWKNSIRNILSRNPGFKKANQNSRYGHQYSIHPACAGAFLLGQFKITHAEALIAAYNNQNKNSCNSQSTQHQSCSAAVHHDMSCIPQPNNSHINVQEVIAISRIQPSSIASTALGIYKCHD